MKTNDDPTTRYPHSLTLIAERNGGTTIFPVRWMSTNSVHYETCPRCGAKPGYLCVAPSGRRGQGLTGGAHGERMAALQQNRPDVAALSRITPSPIPKGLGL